MWQYLREKSEYGSKMSERGFQQICADNAGILAYKLGLNDALAESLAICKGSYFPVYGKAGKNAVHEYLESKNANKTDNELGYEFVKYDKAIELLKNARIASKLMLDIGGINE